MWTTSLAVEVYRAETIYLYKTIGAPGGALLAARAPDSIASSIAV